jgi:hypothetical protein
LNPQEPPPLPKFLPSYEYCNKNVTCKVTHTIALSNKNGRYIPLYSAVVRIKIEAAVVLKSFGSQSLKFRLQSLSSRFVFKTID